MVEVFETSQDPEGVIHVADSAHWYDCEGSLLGVAALPLDEQFIFVTGPTVLGPDGYPYYLLTRPQDVTILQLPWIRAP